MSIQINRRSFLLSLIAVGASYALPANATPAQVDRIWTDASLDPWFFEVNEWDTILVPGYPESETWGEIFSISTYHLKTPSDIIQEINTCEPLIQHFHSLATKEINSLMEELQDDPAPKLLRRRHISKVIKALEDDPDNGWMDWIQLEGKAGVERFKEEIDAWVDEPADYLQSEWFPLDHGSQGQAKRFFESLDWDTLDALGVVIIEGEHPGSSYYAAELRRDVEEANAVAQELGLPFRFRRA